MVKEAPLLSFGVRLFEMRRDREKSSMILNWERPPQNKLGPGLTYLGMGNSKTLHSSQSDQ
ncbi:hypothetical protein F5X99DRAFT_327531 [Biscogniauxia marginata]|nr:hypothetical protein F5X99DRAFT_327531 [Biscogniauxia marginata]